MFTGLIESVGYVSTISPLGEGLEVSITSDLSSELVLGESVSLNGICSTVVSHTSQTFLVQFLKESLDKTTIRQWRVGTPLNMERAMLPTMRLGGHVVTGHVEGCVTISRIDDKGPWHVIEFVFPQNLAPFLIEKGSVTLDGVSLTVVDVLEDRFSCHIIPHTFLQTVLRFKRVLDVVNIEPDVMAKYFYRFYQLEKERKV